MKEKIGRPTKKEAIIIQQRDKELLAFFDKGYPVDYICAYFNLTKGRVSQIINKRKK